MARASGVFEGVRFLGYVPDEDLAALYRRAGALLFLSRLEGFGLPVAEAMAASCPSIVARDSGSDEVAGDAGIAVDADDHRAAADAILSLTRFEESRKSLVTKGLARVSIFDRREMARAYVRSYQRALA
jgi:glycosyltransferase involved in cell wall biosynthesis